ncbi:uncharacterized protein NECHADRAFT_83503 [Fusarium vanettenii 77-13-4]|uniref:Uncharacterized protein n=1 Tax=Fusarium vanettenii (strain ATCC MYA-4622 / CBS 123669 / FGSC 9596 / NRRL 45880 / 77-13-4) TaxID=660122 RepID=C7Z472_FUSV7|nr:uncharacterized protein NECHADRAFT_83503 [Fusarium vanettenii 77-13-4]EEU41430.1 predicted protein [Fusarium vanettenii 77-13-4]
MDQSENAADEVTALAGPRQQYVVARRASAAPFWNAASPTENEGDIWELFEVYRRSANRYLNQYFDCLDRLRASSADISAGGRSQEIAIRGNSEGESDVWLLKISHDSAVRDLVALDKILDKAKSEGKPRGRDISPALKLWTFTCSILALIIPKKVTPTLFQVPPTFFQVSPTFFQVSPTFFQVSSVFFQVGAIAGALLLTSRIFRKPPRVNRLDPVQHKVLDLIRSFEQDAMKQRDRGEVLISPVDLDT